MKNALFTFCFALIALPLWAVNPMNFREYTQGFTLQFANDADAKAAVISARALPNEYELAYSSRWDDCNDKHLKTLKIMNAHGIKGTFFLTDWDRADIVKKLTADGSSVGLHTATHPLLPAQNSYHHFWEYMENRICIETLSQTAVNSQVLPFCNWWAPLPLVPQSVGWAMRASGVISAPDVLFPNRELEMGYPEKCLAQSRFVAPGDQNPDLARHEREMKRALENKKNLSLHPSISMAMHSWHTEEGYVNLDKAYASVANNPKWWYCNQTEYGAYRYEALNDAITTRVDGKTVHVTVTRMEPFELAASLPLWFTVDHAKPVSANGAILHEQLVELPHAAGHTVPTVFGRMQKGNAPAPQIPFATLSLRHVDANQWTADFQTTDGKAVEALAFTFRFPAVWTHETMRFDVGTTASTAVTATQPNKKTELFYRYGKPYYAVQADFIRDGVRYRLYAELSEEEAPNLPAKLSDVVKYYVQQKDSNMAQLSTPGVDPAEIGFVQKNAAIWGPSGVGMLAPANMSKAEWGEYGYIAIAQFRPLNPQEKLTIISTVDDKWSNSELWLNGEKVNFTDRKAEVAVRDGVNRFALRSPHQKLQFIFINGEKEQSVEFLK